MSKYFPEPQAPAEREETGWVVIVVAAVIVLYTVAMIGLGWFLRSIFG